MLVKISTIFSLLKSLEKTDIFCLTLENKYAEARLLNSLLLESEDEIDQNFQNLFNYMIISDQPDKVFENLRNIKSYAKKFNINFNIVRFFNVYGKNQKQNFVIPKFINLLSKSKNLTVYGNGDQIRAFCNVIDAVRGLYLVLN